MINMMKLPYIPRCCQWVHAAGDALAALAMYVSTPRTVPPGHCLLCVEGMTREGGYTTEEPGITVLTGQYLFSTD